MSWVCAAFGCLFLALMLALWSERLKRRVSWYELIRIHRGNPARFLESLVSIWLVLWCILMSWYLVLNWQKPTYSASWSGSLAITLLECLIIVAYLVVWTDRANEKMTWSMALARQIKDPLGFLWSSIRLSAALSLLVLTGYYLVGWIAGV